MRQFLDIQLNSETCNIFLNLKLILRGLEIGDS